MAIGIAILAQFAITSIGITISEEVVRNHEISTYGLISLQKSFSCNSYYLDI